MSKELSITTAQVPAHLAARIGQQSKLAMSLGTGKGDSAPPRISIKGGRFRIVQDGAESMIDQTYLDVVVVGANPNLSKTFYAKAWDKDAEPAGPDCYSLDGIKPDPSVQDPENDICASCPKNAWGSKVMPNGQQTKACADQKRLAVVAADDPTGDIYLLQVTPSALKGLNKYQKELSIRGIPPEIVRTKVSLDPDVSYPKLVFSFAGFLDEDTQSAVDTLFGSIPVLEITGEKLVERPVEQPVAPKPAAVTPKEEPAPAPVEPTAEKPRGFGASKKAEAPKPQAEEPKAAPVADKEATSLADEIAALVDEVGYDDE